MRVPGKRFKISDAIVARADFEECPEDKSTQRGVPAGTSAGYRHASRIRFLILDDEPGSFGTILHINDTPRSPEPIPVIAAIAGAAAVINIKDRIAATGPILGSQVQGAGRGRRGSAVALDDQGRQFPRRRGKCIVERSVVPCVNISSR